MFEFVAAYRNTHQTDEAMFWSNVSAERYIGAQSSSGPIPISFVHSIRKISLSFLRDQGTLEPCKSLKISYSLCSRQVQRTGITTE